MERLESDGEARDRDGDWGVRLRGLGPGRAGAAPGGTGMNQTHTTHTGALPRRY